MKPTFLAAILALSATAATACQQPPNVCDDQDPERNIERPGPIDKDNPLDPPVDKPEPTPEPPLDDGR